MPTQADIDKMIEEIRKSAGGNVVAGGQFNGPSGSQPNPASTTEPPAPAIQNQQSDLPTTSPSNNEFKGFSSVDAVEESCVLFNDPVDMLYTIDDELLGGKYKLHPWQVRIMLDFAKESNSDNPFRGVLRAANGSGKDQKILAPCALWMLLRYPEALTILTSSSGFQLDTRTDAPLKRLANCANRKLFGNEPILKINYRHYTNLRNGSITELFATDEPGKAEGAHPISPGRHFFIGVSEAKTVEEKIFQALHRCNGFTKRLDVSSPGMETGSFYNHCTRDDDTWTQYHVTAFDCPHLSAGYIKETEKEYGLNSTFYNSMILAEFGGTSEDLIVMGYLPLNRLYKSISKGEVKYVAEEFNTGGLDLSMGGDEQVLIIRNGNKVLGIETFHITDANEIESHLHNLFEKWHLNDERSVVYADAGGSGAPIINHLRRAGYENVRYVTNQSTPRNKFAYNNIGTEGWFHLKRLIELEIPILPDNDLLKSQLATRYYKIDQKNRYCLELKKEAKAKGHKSPDRGDALVLAFSTYNLALTLDGSFKDSVVITRQSLDDLLSTDDGKFRYMSDMIKDKRKGSDIMGGHRNQSSISKMLPSQRMHLEFLLSDIRNRPKKLETKS